MSSTNAALHAVSAADAVTACNLGLLDLNTAGSLEARIAHLRELAAVISADQPSLPTLLDRLNGTALTRALPDGLPDNQAFLACGFSALTLLEQTALCRMVCKLLGSRIAADSFFESDEPLPANVRGTIAYPQNTFTDRAFRAFSNGIRRPRAQYHDSYAAACEAVAGGGCEACILPIEHEQDGKLLGFYRLIDRYELKITRTCDLAEQNGMESRFALLQKNVVLPRQIDALAQYLEISITRSAAHSVAAIIEAANQCGLELRRIDSIPLVYAEDSFAYHAVCTIPEPDLLPPFLLYLTLAVPQYNPIGIYAHISA
ncbi:MAG: hypothetical protein IKD37_01965 [Clostridia bacterium]|nr:hypothetical protein [Clostridia bacterium]